MGSLNKAQLIGNLGRDAEVKYTPGGQPVATFSVATTERFTTKAGEAKEQTEWHRCVLWGKPAESLQQYLVKGKQVYVEGKIQTRSWEKDGVKRYTTEVNVRNIVLLGGKRSERRDDDAPIEDSRDDRREPVASAVGEDDIPF